MGYNSIYKYNVTLNQPGTIGVTKLHMYIPHDMSEWDSRFFAMARLVGDWSKDPSTKVGCVIVDANKKIISVGYNGFPRGVVDSQDRLQNRELKYQYVVHAEVNAILNANKSDLSGCTLYVQPLLCCNECAKVIIQSGIKHVKCLAPEYDLDDKTKDAEYARPLEPFRVALDMFNEAKVTVKAYANNEPGNIS